MELIGAHIDFINKGVNVLRYSSGKAFKLFKRGVEIAYIFFGKLAFRLIKRGFKIGKRLRIVVFCLQACKTLYIGVKIRYLVGMEHTRFTKYRDHLVDVVHQTDDVHGLH